MDALLTEDDILGTATGREAVNQLRGYVHDREKVALAIGHARQQRIAEANARIKRKTVEGLGELKCSMDSKLFFNLGIIHGFDAFNDEAFIDDCIKKNPEIRVNRPERKAAIIVPAWR